MGVQKITMQSSSKNTDALKFVLLIGVVSFFADFTYESSRSIIGPYLALLGASGAAVGIIAGLGELLGYGLRLVSGPFSERTRKFWPVTLTGYCIQMISVPSLALVDSWRRAAILIILERVGKAIRNPPRDVMLSHAAKEMGYGWGFGVHEAFDQSGAVVGPLLVASVLSRQVGYHRAFGMLLVPALTTLAVLMLARIIYPRPELLETENATELHSIGFPRVFWIYLVGAGLVAAGFADFSLIAYHFQKNAIVPKVWVPIFYSVSMTVSGAGSLFFGRLLDRLGASVLVPLTLISALSTPLVFLGNYWLALIGVSLWGLGMGVHESVIPAIVARMVPPDKRGSAYGIFTGGYGVSWFAGSVVIGVLYDVRISALIVFSVLLQLIAVLFFISVKTKMAVTVGHPEASRYVKR